MNTIIYYSRHSKINTVHAKLNCLYHGFEFRLIENLETYRKFRDPKKTRNIYFVFAKLHLDRSIYFFEFIEHDVN